MGDERAQQRRAALAQHGAHAALRGEVLERRGRRRPAGREAVDGDVGAAPREVAVGLRVDLDPRPRLGEQRDLDGHVAAARDRRDERLGGEAALGPPLALVVVEQVGVALGAQRAGADEDRVHRRPQLAQQRACRPGGRGRPSALRTVARPSAEAIIAAATCGRPSRRPGVPSPSAATMSAADRRRRRGRGAAGSRSPRPVCGSASADRDRAAHDHGDCPRGRGRVTRIVRRPPRR